ncbi:MAG TPA: response regulator [Bryobacteraceae bacterium]|nr:response regulator [Bryobacteraceae bacterium]
MATVLVVDDDADQLDLRAMALRGAGHTVLEAADVASAAACDTADLVVMDLRLPTIADGLRLIASLGSRAPIIVLTGGAAENLPVARVLRKPCRSRLLLDTIAEVLAEA